VCVEQHMFCRKMSGDDDVAEGSTLILQIPHRRGECRQIGTRLVCQTCNLELHSSLYWQPMELTRSRSDVVSTLYAGEQTSSSVLHELHLPQQVLRHTIQQRVAAVQATRDKSLNDGLSSVERKWPNSC